MKRVYIESALHNVNNKEELNSFSLPTCTRSNRMEQYRDAIRNVHHMSTELGGSLRAETKIDSIRSTA